MDFQCRRIDESLTPVEHLVFHLNPALGVLSVTGISTLRSIVIDDVEAIVNFRTAKNGCVISDGFVLILCAPSQSDFVLLFSAQSTVDEVVQAIRDMKAQRGKSNRSLSKLIVYLLDSFDDLVSPGTWDEDAAQRHAPSASGASLTVTPSVKSSASAPTSYIRWRADFPQVIIPFPHSRLDFLQFRRNKSVMCKLSANYDTSIELSCDNVAVAGSFSADASSSGNDSGSVSSADITAWCRALKNAVAAKGAAADMRQLLLADARARCFQDGNVVILSDRTLYISEKSGKVVLQLTLSDLSHAATVTHDLQGNRLAQSFLVMIAAEEELVLVIRSKYCADMLNRLQVQPLMHAVISAPPQNSLIPTSLEVLAMHDSQRSLAGGGTIGGHAAASSNPPSCSTAAYPQGIRMLVACGVQTDDVGRPPTTLTAAATSPIAPSSGDDAAAHEELSHSASTFILRSTIGELRDELAHRDMTIRVLQQRCDQLASQVLQFTGDLAAPPPQAAAAGGKVSQGVPAAVVGKSAPITPRSTTPTTPRKPPSGKLAVAGTNANAKQHSSHRSASGASSVMLPGDVQNFVSTLVRQIESLRFYTALLQEENIRLRSSEWKERCELLERELTDAAAEHSASSPAAMEQAQLSYALHEAQRLLRQSQQKNTSLQRELDAVNRATDEHLQQFMSEARLTVQRFVQEERERRTAEYQRVVSLQRSWEALSGGHVANEVKIAEEVKVRTAELTSMNMSLMQDLRLREQNLDKINDELMRYFTVDSNHTDINHFFRDAIQQLSGLMRSGDLLAERQGMVLALEGNIRALMRQIEDLKQSRDSIVAEGKEAAQLIDALRDPPEIAKELEQLRAQIAMLQRLQSVPVAIARTSGLECMVTEQEGKLLEGMTSKERVHAAEEQLKSKQTEIAAVKDESAKLRRSLESTEAALSAEANHREQLEHTLSSMRAAHLAETSKLKLELRDQRARLHDAIQVTKRSRTPLKAGGAAMLKPNPSSMEQNATPMPQSKKHATATIDESTIENATNRDVSHADGARSLEFTDEGRRAVTVPSEPNLSSDVRGTGDPQPEPPTAPSDQPVYSQADLDRILTQVATQRETFSQYMHDAVADFRAHGGVESNSAVPPFGQGSPQPGTQQQQQPYATAATTVVARSFDRPSLGGWHAQRFAPAGNETPAESPATHRKKDVNTSAAVSSTGGGRAPFNPSVKVARPTAAEQEAAAAPATAGRRPVSGAVAQPQQHPPTTTGRTTGPSTGASSAATVANHHASAVGLVAPVSGPATQQPQHGGSPIRSATSVVGRRADSADVKDAERDLMLMNERIGRLEAERKRAEADERAARMATELALIKAQVTTTTTTKDNYNYNGGVDASAVRDAYGSMSRESIGGSRSPSARRPHNNNGGGAASTPDAMLSAYSPAVFVGQQQQQASSAQAFGVVPPELANDAVAQAKLRYAALRQRLNMRTHQQ